MHPNPGKVRRDTWWESARFHLCLRQGAGRQFPRLEVDSAKMAFSRPTHQRVPVKSTPGRPRAIGPSKSSTILLTPALRSSQSPRKVRLLLTPHTNRAPFPSPGESGRHDARKTFAQTCPSHTTRPIHTDKAE